MGKGNGMWGNRGELYVGPDGEQWNGDGEGNKPRPFMQEAVRFVDRVMGIGWGEDVGGHGGAGSGAAREGGRASQTANDGVIGRHRGVEDTRAGRGGGLGVSLNTPSPAHAQPEMLRRQLPPGRLYDDFSRHASGQPAAMDGVVEVDSSFVGTSLAGIIVPRSSLSLSTAPPHKPSRDTSINTHTSTHTSSLEGRGGGAAQTGAGTRQLVPFTPPLPSMPCEYPSKLGSEDRGWNADGEHKHTPTSARLSAGAVSVRFEGAQRESGGMRGGEVSPGRRGSNR